MVCVNQVTLKRILKINTQNLIERRKNNPYRNTLLCYQMRTGPQGPLGLQGPQPSLHLMFITCVIKAVPYRLPSKEFLMCAFLSEALD